MAARRQDAWEAQLKEKAFLSATIKPIVVDETVNYKPPHHARVANARTYATGH